MPDVGSWQSFFDADCMVEKLECAVNGDETIAEFGSGYGTFTFPVAKKTTGIVYAFDIEPDLVDALQKKAKASKTDNLHALQRDLYHYGMILDRPYPE